MVWTVKYTISFQKNVQKLDRSVQKKIKCFFEQTELIENPRQKGKPLTANLSGLWRYRIEDYRIICEIQDSEMIVLALRVGHRDKVYKKSFT
ncbi:MAG: type II toxin-antitoxin system mRNA interferase toxin, RelE/StbE family [Desulfobacterales bacterium]|nr:MAG: type II toxin-antitoxin system mRNA interferase toxin, RelE/StbE family [Desulfobacterales bacterium]